MQLQIALEPIMNVFEEWRGKKILHLREQSSLMGSRFLSMDNGHVIRTIFKNIPNNWQILADGSNEFGVFWGKIYYGLGI